MYKKTLNAINKEIEATDDIERKRELEKQRKEKIFWNVLKERRANKESTIVVEKKEHIIVRGGY